MGLKVYIHAGETTGKHSASRAIGTRKKKKKFYKKMNE